MRIATPSRILLLLASAAAATASRAPAQPPAVPSQAAPSQTAPPTAAADPLAAYRAIDQLGYQTDNAAEAVAKLTALLADADPQARWRSARALGNLAASAAPAAPRLVELLGDADPVAQLHAGVALARIGDTSVETVDGLLSLVASDDERVARAAIQALRELQVDPKRLARAVESVLASGDAVVMSHGVAALVESGPRAVPLLNAMLAGEQSAYWAALVIAEIGPPAAGCSDALTAMINDRGDAETLQQGLVAAAKIGPAAVAVGPSAQRVAKETESDGVRIAACYALGAVGDATATPLLVDLHNAGGPFQRVVAAWSIAKLNPDDPAAEQKAIGVLTAALASGRPEVRAAAAEGLATLGSPVEKIAPAFVAAVAKASDADKANIADALVGLGPAVAPAMVRALGEPATRDVAIEVLARLREELTGPAAADAVEGLAEQIDQCAEDQLARLQYALAEFGPAASAAADRIAANLKHQAAEVRHSALFALREIGAASDAAVGGLADVLRSAEDEFERGAAAWALARTRLEAATLSLVASRLEESLDHPDERVRLETVRAIKDLGPAGAPFAARLKQMAENDPSPAVREAAENQE